MKLKRITSALLAAAMMMALSVPAFAAQEPATEDAAPAQQTEEQPETAEAAEPAQEQLTYVALGDSIVAGVGLKGLKYTSAPIGLDLAENFEGYPKKCYVARIAKSLNLDRQHAIDLGLPGL